MTHIIEVIGDWIVDVISNLGYIGIVLLSVRYRGAYSFHGLE